LWREFLALKDASTSDLKFLGIIGDDRYRNISESRIVEMLMVMGGACETDSAATARASQQALQDWIGIGLPFKRGSDGQRFFDPVETHNFMKRAGLEGRDGFWAERYVQTGRRLVASLGSAQASDSSRSDERPFKVEFKRTFNLQSITPGSRLRLRAPCPLPGSHLTDSRTAPFVETSDSATIEARNGRLEARLISTGESEVTIGARYDFKVRPYNPERTEPEPEPDPKIYLRPREGLIAVSERVRTLARSLAGANASPLDSVRAFLNYFNTNLICGTLRYDQIDATSPCDWVLDAGWFDCQMGSALLVAMCRACGIPARVIGGYFLYPQAPMNHFWPEVWIAGQGWTPFDFLGWELSQNGRDLEWFERFFGRIDFRMTCERLPTEFIGAVGVPISRAWSILPRGRGDGVEIYFLGEDGVPIYTDAIGVIAGSEREGETVVSP
jgi:hypothetical protein